MPAWLTRALLPVLLLPALAVPSVMADEALWAALKDGGKVVLMRHAAVERGASPLKYTPGDCSQDMNLSQAGRTQAQKIGEAFRARGIPVGDVLASPFCRTMDTAKLAFGNAKPSDALRLIEGISAREIAHINTQASRLIGDYKGKANLILVTHQPNVEAIALESLENAGMLVLTPKGGEEFDVLGKLPAPRD